MARMLPRSQRCLQAATGPVRQWLHGSLVGSPPQPHLVPADDANFRWLTGWQHHAGLTLGLCQRRAFEASLDASLPSRPLSQLCIHHYPILSLRTASACRSRLRSSPARVIALSTPLAITVACARSVRPRRSAAEPRRPARTRRGNCLS